MHAVFLIALWSLVIIASTAQRQEFKEFVKHVWCTNRQRRRIKSAIHIYDHLYSNADSDYLRGFYYGKIGGLKSELNEIKYFGKEW